MPVEDMSVDPVVSEYMTEKVQKRWAKGRARQAMAEALTGGEPHPLFPTEPGEPVPQIDWINVTRFERRGPVDCPKVFAASELVSLEELATMYGGGSYELRGRCSGSSGQPGPMVRRARYTIDGPAFPFTGEDSGEAEPPPALPMGAPGGPVDPMVMFMTMMKESAAEARAASERQNTMLIAMMTQSSQQQSASMQAMASIMAAAMQSRGDGPDVAALLTAASGMSSAQMSAFAAMVPRPDNSDPMEKAAKLLELAKAVKGDADSLTSLLAGFGQAAAGIASLEQASTQARSQTPQAAPPPQEQASAPEASSVPPPTPAPNGARRGPNELAALE